jgi:hypothetical protein
MSGLAPGEKVQLRLTDLRKHTKASRVMQVKVPATIAAGIERVAMEVGCGKTAAVTALLNEGLDALAHKRKRRKKARRL